MRLVLAVLVAVVACGDGGARPAPMDAPSDAAPVVDAPGFPACGEFGVASVAVPAHVISALDTADLESPLGCSEIDAPFGVESAGPDRVIPLRNLTAGTAYVVRVISPSDLAFYVVTGCSTARGPNDGECLLFEDASVGEREVGRFVAASSTAYIVVDFYASQPPDSLEFTLDVYAEACQSDGECGGATPACFEGHCVQCVSSFDCASSDMPVCGDNQTCQVGIDQCTIDTTDEPADDGPAGATLIALDGVGYGAPNGKICSSPASEFDYFAFDVGSLGEAWEFQLSWIGGRDLDLELYDASGRLLGLSFWEQPEVARLSYLPAGRYYARISEFASTPDASPVTYQLSAQRTLGTGCTSASDCATDYRNQLYRGSCDAGACVPIDGDGAVAEGGACDSQSDCANDLQCPAFFFVAASDSRGVCARECTSDSECGPLGADYVCTTYLSENFCVQKCSLDDHCPVAVDAQPTAGPWTRLTCDLPTGHCVP
ncbi:MAG: hypothetical protein AB7O24_28840 [Kofleriaceae bacterium]